MLQRPANAFVVEHEGTEYEWFLSRDLDIPQPPLADTHLPEVVGSLARRHALKLLYAIRQHAAPWQLGEGELRPIAERVGGDHAPGDVDEPHATAECQRLLVYHHLPRGRELARRDRHVLPLISFGEEPEHDVQVPFLRHGDGEPVRRPVPAIGLGEQAHVAAVHQLPVVCDVREAGQLVRERVEDEARDVEVAGEVELSDTTAGVGEGEPTGGALLDDAQVRVEEEEEAVAAGGADLADDRLIEVAVGARDGGGLDEVQRDAQIGGVRRPGEAHVRALCSGVRLDDAGHHTPRGMRGDGGEGAAEATGDGCGEAQERHLAVLTRVAGCADCSLCLGGFPCLVAPVDWWWGKQGRVLVRAYHSTRRCMDGKKAACSCSTAHSGYFTGRAHSGPQVS